MKVYVTRCRKFSEFSCQGTVIGVYDSRETAQQEGIKFAQYMNNRDKTVYGSDLYTYGIDHMILCEIRYLPDETEYIVKATK